MEIVAFAIQRIWRQARNRCRSCVRLSFQAPSDFGSKPEWMESSGRTGIFPSIHFLMFLSLMESFRLRCIKRSIDSIRISERMVSAPPGQRLRTTRSTHHQVYTPPGLHTTRSTHQVIPLLLAATRLLIKGQAEHFLIPGP